MGAGVLREQVNKTLSPGRADTADFPAPGTRATSKSTAERLLTFVRHLPSPVGAGEPRCPVRPRGGQGEDAHCPRRPRKGRLPVHRRQRTASVGRSAGSWLCSRDSRRPRAPDVVVSSQAADLSARPCSGHSNGGSLTLCRQGRCRQRLPEWCPYTLSVTVKVPERCPRPVWQED